MSVALIHQRDKGFKPGAAVIRNQRMVFCCFELAVLAVLLGLPFLYEISSQFRYYLKFSLYYGIVMATALVVIPFMMFRPGEVKNLLLASCLCRHISTLLGLRWELRGREHLEKEQACVIVANHQSSLDILGKKICRVEVKNEMPSSVEKKVVWRSRSGLLDELYDSSSTDEGLQTIRMFELWPVMDKCTAVAKKELLYAWPFGLAAWLCGLVFIDRVNSGKAKESINQATHHIKQNKIKLWIFPEGTRNNKGSMLPFKKGAFHVAVSAQLPILPAVFSSYYFLDHDTKTLDQGRVLITFLPPVDTTGLCHDDIESLMERTRADMIAEFHRSSSEVLAGVQNQITPKC